MIYLLDTNVISDLMRENPQVRQNYGMAVKRGDTLYLPDPVKFEIMRGLYKRDAKNWIEAFQHVAASLTVPIISAEDWLTAARLWAETSSRGRQLSIIDLLIAALATNLTAVIVTSDKDFAGINVPIEDWRSGPIQGEPNHA